MSLSYAIAVGDIMGPISIKGLVAGFLFNCAMSFVLGLALGFVMAAMFGAEGAKQLIDPGASGMAVPVMMVEMVVSVAGGYVAARVAGRGELINATLCIFISGAIGAYFTPEATLGIYIVELVIVPLFGLFGGYIRLRQVDDLALQG